MLEKMVSFQHENICPVSGYYLEGSDLRLILQHVNGGDLSRFLRSSSPLSWDTQQKFIQQATAAVNYLHCWNPNPILHRDLKANNFLMEGSQLLLTDVGLITLKVDSKNHSWRWKAPEVVNVLVFPH